MPRISFAPTSPAPINAMMALAAHDRAMPDALDQLCHGSAARFALTPGVFGQPAHVERAWLLTQCRYLPAEPRALLGLALSCMMSGNMKRTDFDPLSRFGHFEFEHAGFAYQAAYRQDREHALCFLSVQLSRLAQSGASSASVKPQRATIGWEAGAGRVRVRHGQAREQRGPAAASVPTAPAALPGGTPSLALLTACRRAGISTGAALLDGIASFCDRTLLPASFQRLAPLTLSRMDEDIYRASYYRPDGSVLACIFKPLNSARPAALAYSVAASRLNQRLGWDVIAPTEFAEHDNRPGIASHYVEGRHPDRSQYCSQQDVSDCTAGRIILEHASLRARGQAVPALLERRYQGALSVLVSHRVDDGRVLANYYYSDHDFAGPHARRELVKLQLIDVLIGQRDRPSKGYIVQRGGQDDVVSGIKGIGNARCFSVRPNELAELARRRLNIGPPELVDHDMLATVLALEPLELANLFDGLLNRDEIGAAAARLLALQAYLKALAPDQIIAPDEWSERHDFHRQRSYVARDGNPYGLPPQPVSRFSLW